jgi:bifunctional non-homologous end joining protein LigD
LRYVSGETSDWVKVKCWVESECEILGVQRDPGKPTIALMGEPGSREYVGGAFVVFGRPKADEFKAFVEANLGPPPREFRRTTGTVQWLRPGVAGTVRHLRGDDKLRHAMLIDWRT